MTQEWSHELTEKVGLPIGAQPNRPEMPDLETMGEEPMSRSCDR